jgi:hypothetical protein
MERIVSDKRREGALKPASGRLPLPRPGGLPHLSHMTDFAKFFCYGSWP